MLNFTALVGSASMQSSRMTFRLSWRDNYIRPSSSVHTLLMEVMQQMHTVQMLHPVLQQIIKFWQDSVPEHVCLCVSVSVSLCLCACVWVSLTVFRFESQKSQSVCVHFPSWFGRETSWRTWVGPTKPSVPWSLKTATRQVVSLPSSAETLDRCNCITNAGVSSKQHLYNDFQNWLNHLCCCCCCCGCCGCCCCCGCCGCCCCGCCCCCCGSGCCCCCCCCCSCCCCCCCCCRRNTYGKLIICGCKTKHGVPCIVS